MMGFLSALGFYLLDFIMSYTATVGFAVLFNVPKKELWYCGACGACGWTLYKLIASMSISAGTGAVFFAAVLITFISRILAYRRRMPQSVYLIGGIIPLVPGTAIYDTMYAGVTGNVVQVLTRGLDTLKIAGVIAVGIMAVLSLPWKWFLIFQKPLDAVAQKK